MCCVLLERGVAGEKIQAAFLSSSALEVIYKTTVERREQRKLHQQRTTWLNRVSRQEMCPVSCQAQCRCPCAVLAGIAHPRSLQQAAAHLRSPAAGCSGGLHRWAASMGHIAAHTPHSTWAAPRAEAVCHEAWGLPAFK